MRSPQRSAVRATQEPPTPGIEPSNHLYIDALRLTCLENRFLLNSNTSLPQFLESANATPFLRRGRGNRRSTLEIVANPFLSGELAFRQPRHQIVTFSARLNLNPTRLQGIHPHDARTLASLDALSLIAPEGAPDTPSYATLDGATNFIPEARRLSAQEHMALTHRYIAAAFEFVDHYLFNVANMLGSSGGSIVDFMLTDENDDYGEDHVRRHNWTECTIYRCEIYTEQNEPEAIDHVHRIAPVLAAQSLAAQRREYMSSQGQDLVRSPVVASRERASNSPSLTVPLGREDVELSLYAKTTNTVRYEVRYKSNLRRLLGRNAPRRRGGTSDIAAVYELLAVAMDDARTRLERVFREVRPALDERPRRLPTFVNLVYYLSQSAGGDRRILTDLTAMLVRDGGVEPRTAPHLRAACEYLVGPRVRVLRRPQVSIRSPQRRYVLTQRYRPFVDLLREAIDVTP